MASKRPAVLQPAPSVVGAALGGLVGTVLCVSLMYAAPVWGGRTIDVLRTVGGVFASRGDVALGVGFAITCVFGTMVWPPAIVLAWAYLPGACVSVPGAIVKGLASGVGAWILFGVVLGIGTTLNRLAATELPGIFAVGSGAGGAIGLFFGSVLYGLSVAIAGGMENAISPVDTLGWKHFYHAAVGARDFGAHRSTPDRIPQRDD